MKISITSLEKINAELDAVQARCTARCLDAKKIAFILSEIEKELKLPKIKLKGVRVDYSGAEKFPNAYKYAPESTHFSAVHTGREWQIVDIRRAECPNRLKACRVTLTDDAKAALIARFEEM